MHLTKLIILNYRSCQNVQINFNDRQPNILIGINDSGKSSILKAADLLFNDKPLFNFIKDNSAKNDLSNTTLTPEQFTQVIEQNGLPNLIYNRRQCYVIGKLNIGDNELTQEILSSLSPTARWALESNNSNFIWIAKVFDTSNNASKSYVILNDFLEDGNNLAAYSLTSTQLNRLVTDLAIPQELRQNENNAGPLSIIEKIRAVYQVRRPSPIWCEFKFEKGDKNLLPTFRYLDWNYSLDEIKSLAADAMHGLVEEHLTPLKVQAKETANTVTEGINEKLKDIQSIIGLDSPSITAIKTKVYIDIKESITDIVINKTNADGDIHLDAQGEGIKRQIWFAMIKAAAVAAHEQGHNYNKFIWAFDEPETHLYPTAQRQLFEIMRSISLGNVQTILSTHSTIFIDRTKLNSIIGVIQNDVGYTELYGIDNINAIFENLEVRNSDFLFFNKFLIIEGDTEAYLVPRLYKIWKRCSHEEDNIQIINIKGKDKWIEAKQILENIFRHFRKDTDSLVFLFDNDASYKIGQEAISENMFFIGIQDIEDSIDSNVWLNICNDRLNEWEITISIEEIEAIKNSIPNDRFANNAEKFYPKLQRLLKEKVSEHIRESVTYNLLSDKGSDSGEMILNYLTDRNMINPRIIEAFERLNHN
ncbi:AAA family ATPase [Chitinophaga sp.]|uniref:AAA family ATPase n=1 Tax=Chitinophaga sp. TaxID=1869181 RepID=UPI0031DD0376